MSASIQIPETLSLSSLNVALVGPDELRRKAVAGALNGGLSAGLDWQVREFSSYPYNLSDVPTISERGYDVAIIDLDSDPERALDLVEHIHATGAAIAMVYSEHADPELLVRCMRAGAREFLTSPCDPSAMVEALARASVRNPGTRPAPKACGKSLVFLGAKGGSGVTTVACDFAISLAHDFGKSTLLIDLNLPLGDAALDLGISAKYSTANALQESSRLDSRFLASLLTKHSSGLQVLAAPGRFPRVKVSIEAIDKLLAIARRDFEYVVVDAGSRLDLEDSALFAEASTFYVVTQVGLSELRNANRLIAEFLSAFRGKLEIVLNRYTPRTLGIDEAHIKRALTQPAQWQIPSDPAAAQRIRNTAAQLTKTDSAISRVIREMARSACGAAEAPEKKKGFSFFR
jgi:pilus assembly protein CpaE